MWCEPYHPGYSFEDKQTMIEELNECDNWELTDACWEGINDVQSCGWGICWRDANEQCGLSL